LPEKYSLAQLKIALSSVYIAIDGDWKIWDRNTSIRNQQLETS
jgi:hypothetical protein